MRRRDVLGSLGGTGITAVLAGCVDGILPSRDEEAAEPGTEISAPYHPYTGDQATAVDIGTRSELTFSSATKAVDVHVWNAGTVEQDLRLSVTEGPPSVTPRAETVTVPVDEYATVALNVPGNYEVSVGRRDSGKLVSLPFVPDDFNCTNSYAYVAVDDDGSTESDGLISVDRSHDGACAWPDLVSTSFDTGPHSCSSEGEHRNAITYEDSEIAVEGVILGPDDCAEAVLESVTYDPDHDRVDVVVAASVEDDCKPTEDCNLSLLHYDATLQYEAALPYRVRVYHNLVRPEPIRVEEDTRAMHY